MIAFNCPGCGKLFKVKEEYAGKRSKCPGCGKPVLEPMPEATVAATPSEVGKAASAPAAPPGKEAGHPMPPQAPASSPVADLPTQAPSTAASAARPANGSLSDTLGGAPSEPVGAAPELTGFLAPAEAPDEIGRLGPYRVLAVLGQGGMGVVFKAMDPHLDRLVALKAMLPTMASTPGARESFFREAKAAAALKHPHIVTIFQVGEDRGAPFLAMEFLEGEPLDKPLEREGKLPVPELARIGLQTALGLAAAHEKGLIHRDIKPANLWLEGKAGQVKILDFGLARSLENQ